MRLLTQLFSKGGQIFPHLQAAKVEERMPVALNIKNRRTIEAIRVVFDQMEEGVIVLDDIGFAQLGRSH